MKESAELNRNMSFWEHVYEFRRRLFFVIFLLIPTSVVSYFLFPYYIDAFHYFLGENLYATNITEGFLMRLRISILSGCFIALPGLLIQIVLFIFPALEKRQKRNLFFVIISVFILFTGGVLFALESVFPLSINFLKSEDFFPGTIERIISYNRFVSFFFQFLLGFGVCFQFPVILVFLIKSRLVTTSYLAGKFKYFIALILLVSALLTPPDIISQLLLAVPMALLYLLTLLLCKIFKWGVD